MDKLEEAFNVVKQKGTLLYPTDTVWGIGCDATIEEAVQKVFAIKKRSESKSLIVLVDSVKMLSAYVPKIPSKALEILNETDRPTTIIYSDPIGLAKNCIASDNTIAIRIVANEFCKELIRKLGNPLVSTSANISGEPTPKSFSEISQTILDSVDYIVALQQEKTSTTSSRILRVTTNNEVEVIRE